MDKILICNLHTSGILGVNDWERNSKREVIISLEIHGDFKQAAVVDDIQQCVDYSQVVKHVNFLVENSNRFTIEALAEDIANLVLTMQGVQQVMVKVEKPGAIRNADSVGVEILRVH